MGYEVWLTRWYKKMIQFSLDISTPLPFPPSIVESEDDSSS